MRNKLHFIVFLISFVTFSQISNRQLVIGKIKSDSLEIENITIFNVTSNIGAVTDIDGKFSINIREKDTLVIQGLAYISKKYIIQKTDLDRELMEIYLKTRINELNVVEVSPFTLTGNLVVDTKKIKTYTPDFSAIDFSKLKPDDVRNSKPVNSTSPIILAPTTVNFLAIFGFIGKGFKQLISSEMKKISSHEKAFNAKRLKEVKSKTFAEHMKENFSNHFFVNQLKIKNEDIPLFLNYSDINSEELVEYLKSENHLKLIEYLISKAEDFKKQQ